MDNDLLREVISLNLCGLIALFITIVCFCIYKIVATIFNYCFCIYEEIVTAYEVLIDLCKDNWISDMFCWIAERRQAQQLNNLLAEADREIARATQLAAENRANEPFRRQSKKDRFKPKRKISVVTTAKTTIHKGDICFTTGQSTNTCQCPNCK